MKKIDLRFKKKPQISVIISFFNNCDTLEKSLKSILNQSYKNFELIIISDGSNDGSNKIVKKFLIKKNNVLYFESKKNIGLTKMLNIGIKFSRGEYIARHDADDLSLSSRFKNQIDILKKKKNLDIIGSNAKYAYKNKTISIKMPEKDRYIKKKLIFRNTIIHSTVMMRKKIFQNNLSYDEKFIRCQDYELWLRIKNKVKFYNIQKELVFRNVKTENFKIKDLLLTSKSRFIHCNYFLSFLLLFRDIFIFILKKI